VELADAPAVPVDPVDVDQGVPVDPVDVAEVALVAVLVADPVGAVVATKTQTCTKV